MGNEGVIVAVAVLLGLWGASRAKTFTGKIGVLLAVVVTVALAVSAYR
jgi:ACR3 family arsenite efflux pump ArsB